MGAALEPKVFISSRTKTIGMLLICLALIVPAALLPHDGPMPISIKVAFAFFALGGLVFVWLLLRPQRLVLDSDGLVLCGGLMPSSKVRKIKWSEIDQFLVYRNVGYGGLPGPKMIGMNFAPGAHERTRLTHFNKRLVGVDGALPGLWPDGPERMVQELNSYRDRALRIAEDHQN